MRANNEAPSFMDHPLILEVLAAFKELDPARRKLLVDDIARTVAERRARDRAKG